jgi:hypothetical protein
MFPNRGVNIWRRIERGRGDRRGTSRMSLRRDRERRRRL